MIGIRRRTRTGLTGQRWEKFRELQWTRLPAGETPPAFVERVQRLLSGQLAPIEGRARSTGSAAASRAPAPI